MASSSRTSTGKAPIDTSSGKSLRIKPNTTSVPKDKLEVMIEQVIDFNALSRNGVNAAEFFAAQKWNTFFQLHHGPSYVELVKNFWMKAEVFDREASDRELASIISKDKTATKNTRRSNYGLPEFIETEIRSNVMGLDVTVTQSMIAKIIGVPDSGLFMKGTKQTSNWAEDIKTLMFSKSDKLKDMKLIHRVVYKIILASILPRNTSTDQMSWDHKHLMVFLIKDKKVNLSAYIFNHMCQSLLDTQKKGKLVVPYGRLISEILHQGKLIQMLEQVGLASEEDLGTTFGKVMGGMILFHMNEVKKKDIILSHEDLTINREASEYMDDFPPISKEDNPEVIFEFVKQHFLDTGIIITSEMIPDTAEGKWKPPTKRRVSKEAPTEEEAEVIASEATKSTKSAGESGSSDSTQKRKRSAVKTRAAKPKRRLVLPSVDEEEEEEESVPLIRKRTVRKESAHQASETQKLSQTLQDLPEAEARDTVSQTMQLKQESLASQGNSPVLESQPPTSKPSNSTQPINVGSSSSSSESDDSTDDETLASKYKLNLSPQPRPLSIAIPESIPPTKNQHIHRYKHLLDLKKDLQVPPVQTGEEFAQAVKEYLDGKAKDKADAELLASKTQTSSTSILQEDVIPILESHSQGGELPDQQNYPTSEAPTASEAKAPSLIPDITSPNQPSSDTEMISGEHQTSPSLTLNHPDSPNWLFNQTASEALPVSEASIPESEPVLTSPASEGPDVIMTDASEPPEAEPLHFNQAYPEPTFSQPISAEQEEFTEMNPSNTPSPTSLPNQTHTIHLDPEIQEECMAIFADLQHLVNMRGLLILPVNFQEQWDLLRARIEDTTRRIQAMVLKSQEETMKAWMAEVAERVAEVEAMRNRRQIGDSAFHHQGEGSRIHIAAPWVEELINQDRKSDPDLSELQQEVSRQKLKQEATEATLAKVLKEQEEIKATQLEMKNRQEELLRNQAESSSKLDAILAALAKKP